MTHHHLGNGEVFHAVSSRAFALLRFTPKTINPRRASAIESAGHCDAYPMKKKGRGWRIIDSAQNAYTTTIVAGNLI